MEFSNPITNIIQKKYEDKEKIFKQIIPKAFFIDWIDVNWQIPIHTFNHNDKQKASKFYDAMFLILEKRILILKQNNYCLNAIKLLKKDTHYNFKIAFQGKFFKDRTYSLDIKHFYKWFLEFDNMLKYYWSKEKINEKYPRSTISRLDFSTHKKSNFLKKFVPIRSKKVKAPCNAWTHDNYDFITGIVIGGTSKSCIFTAYDKRWQKDGLQHCQERFGSVDLVRKEWKCFSKYLRSNGISTIKSFMEYFNNPLLVAGFIKKLRLSKDVILFNDNNNYKALHDLRFHKCAKGNFLPIKEFNKIFKSTYNVYLNKIPEKEINKLKWNPFGTYNGMVKYLGNMKRDEFFTLQKNILNKLQDQHCEEWEYADWDEEFYSQMVNMLSILKTVKLKFNPS